MVSMLPSKNNCGSLGLQLLLFFLSGLFFCTSVSADSVHQYPLLKTLETKKNNVVFRQFQDDVAQGYRMMAAGQPCTPAFYRYTAKNGDTLFTLSSRCSLPLETIALINHLPDANCSIAGMTLILPTCAGLYIACEPVLFIETLLCTRFDGVELQVISCNGEQFFFIPQERLSGTERLYFLDSRLKSPLEQSVLTSAFGNRISPITGKEKFHNGIDLAAPLNSPVFACLSGTVSAAGTDDIYGNYVIINHDNNLQSLYAHLSRFTVQKGSLVAGGSVIGYVGITGLTTGPHLHFEVKQNGVPLDPEEFFQK